MKHGTPPPCLRPRSRLRRCSCPCHPSGPVVFAAHTLSPLSLRAPCHAPRFCWGYAGSMHGWAGPPSLSSGLPMVLAAPEAVSPGRHWPRDAGTSAQRHKAHGSAPIDDGPRFPSSMTDKGHGLPCMHPVAERQARSTHASPRPCLLMDGIRFFACLPAYPFAAQNPREGIMAF